jgi:Phage capsid family
MTTFTREDRERLDGIRDRKRETQERINACREAVRIAESHGDADAADLAGRALQEAIGAHSMAVELDNSMVRQISGIGDYGTAESCFDDPTVVRTLAQLAHSTMPIGNLLLGPVHSVEQTMAMIESGSWKGKSLAQVTTDPGPPTDPSRTGIYRGIIPQLRYPLTVLDLIPTATMESGNFFYTVEGGDYSQGVGETPEGSIKPSSSTTLTDAQCVAVTIASYQRLKRQQLNDIAGLATTVNSRLTYSVLRRLQTQVLVGDGVGGNMLGIINTTGIASVPFTAGEPLTDLSLDGITDVILSEANPTGIVVHPTDWSSILKAKATTSGVRLDSDGAFGTPPRELWGLPCVVTPAMAQGTALVGDFTQGCTLHVREGVNLRMSDSDQDAFVRNEVVVLAEGRWGLATWRPSCFALVHLK